MQRRLARRGPKRPARLRRLQVLRRHRRQPNRRPRKRKLRARSITRPLGNHFRKLPRRRAFPKFNRRSRVTGFTTAIPTASGTRPRWPRCRNSSRPTGWKRAASSTRSACKNWAWVRASRVSPRRSHCRLPRVPRPRASPRRLLRHRLRRPLPRTLRPLLSLPLRSTSSNRSSLIIGQFLSLTRLFPAGSQS